VVRAPQPRRGAAIATGDCDGARLALASPVRNAAAALLLPLLTVGCLADRNSAIVFPARYDVSPVTMATSRSAVTGLHLAGALSWASVSPHPRNRIDVAVGYQVESYPAPAQAGATTQALSEGDTGTGDVATGDPDRIAGPFLHGPFVELGYRLAGNDHARLWLAGRGELLGEQVGGSERAGMGGMLRLGSELFTTARDPMAVGSLALGPYIELGARELPTGVHALVATAGLSLRLPFAAFN
jgi:hypothetical protein